MTIKNKNNLDLLFILDTTSSMGPYIQAAKNSINFIYDSIVKAEMCHLRLGLVSYRDHPPQDHTYLTQVTNLTDDLNQFKTSLALTYAQGGGDLPEAICCAMEKALNEVTWRNDAIKIAILIADAPPHGLGCFGDSFSNGCPLKNDPVAIAHKMAQSEIALYCVGCGFSIDPYKSFFIAASLVTGGQYLELSQDKDLASLIINGTHEEVSNEKLLAEIHEDLAKVALENGTTINEEELTKRINNALEKKEIKSTRSLSSVTLTQEIKELSTKKNIEEFRSLLKGNNFSNTLSIVPKPFGALPIRNVKPFCKIPTKRRIAKKTIKSLLPVYVRRSPRLAHCETGSIFEVVLRGGSRKTFVRRSLRLRNKSSMTKFVSVGQLEAKKEMTKVKRVNHSVTVTTNNVARMVSNDSSQNDFSRRLAKKAIARMEHI